MSKLFAITPFVIIFIGLILYGIYIFFNVLLTSQDTEGWELIIYGVIIASLISIGLVDIVLKLLVKNNNTVIIIEFVIIAIFGLNRLTSDVKNTLVLPEGFNKPYVTIVYDVKGKKKLPNRFNPFKRSIPVNEDGYVLTASSLPSFSYGNEKYVLKKSDNTVIGSKQSNYDYITFQVYKIENDTNGNRFLTFKIQPKEDCCGWNATEVDNHYTDVENYLEDHLK